MRSYRRPFLFVFTLLLAASAFPFLSGCSLNPSTSGSSGEQTDMIQVQQQGTPVKSYDFGSSTVSVAGSPVTFTIVNQGSSTLDLGGAGAVAISGPGAADFTISSPPPATISAGGSADFSIAFTPWSGGVRTGTITVTPAGGASTYSFSVTGTGNSSGSLSLTYVVKKGATTLAAGAVSNGMTFTVPQSVPDNKFNVSLSETNTASSPLYLTGSPAVAFSGSSAAFYVSTPAESFAANTTNVPVTTISLAPNPGLTDQTYTGTFTILSSDGNNSNFTFSVTFTYTGP